MTGADACLSPLHFTEMVDSATDSGVDNENALQQRSNFIDILEHLDPLPDLPDTNEGFFNRDLDFQYPTAPVENPFPTWGNVSSTNLAAMSATAAAASTATPAVMATPMITSTSVTGMVDSTPLPCPNPRPLLSEPIHAVPYAPPVASAAAGICSPPERHVFLRQRLGGESVSSGNSSTSTSSDTGSASDDATLAGEWESRRGVAGGGVARGAVVGGGDADCGGGDGGGGSGRTPTTARKKATTRRKRQAKDNKSNGECRKTGKREGGGSAGGSAGASERAGNWFWNPERSGAYRSWGVLVRPLTQQWDRVEAPALLNTNNQSSETPFSSDCCYVFSTEPRPHNPTCFSFEQCSAQAHTTAIASYVLRVRCGNGAHIVRRTCDDLAALCTMLRRERSIPDPAGDTAAAATASEAEAGVDFAPANVVATDAASGFLKDLLLQPGMATWMPVRRFLELEFLDGTLRGGIGDVSREKAAHVVASMAAGAAQAAAAAAGLASGSSAPLIAPSNTFEPVATVGLGGVMPSGEGAMASPTTGLRLEGSMRVVVPGRGIPSIPPHPDAARDLAAVCRCLGELGAAAFMSVPRATGGAAPYWGMKEDVAVASSGGVGNIGLGPPHRGLAMRA